MPCSAIKLSDRKEEAKRNSTSPTINSAEFMTSDYFHSYSFRWDKPKLFYNCDSAHFLTVNNIILPENAPVFNTGSSIEKWAKKRPRLKSTKPQPRPSSEISEDNLDVTPIIEEISKASEDATPSLETNDSESEIHPDIKNLLCVVNDGSKEESDDCKPRQKKHHHKRKDKSDEKSRKKKAIQFSLSKPPSPQTVQVIRVEVTSNYSMEEGEVGVEKMEMEISDCSKGCGLRIKSANDLKRSLSRVELEEFTGKDEREIMIQCNKLVLCDRN